MAHRSSHPVQVWVGRKLPSIGVDAAHLVIVLIKHEHALNRYCLLLVGMWPGLPVSICQDEFLNAFPGIHFTGVKVSLGVHGDRIDPMELPRHTAVVAN